MAPKKEHTIVSANPNGSAKKPTIQQAAPVGNATGYRVGAIVLWVIAVVFEILAVLVVAGKITFTFMPTLYQLIGLLVLDLICVIIGSQLWKKANHIKPASEKNPTLFWIWNNMGVIVCCFAFIPIIILMLTNKDLDKKTKTIATIAAIIALLIGGATSIDYNPVSAEQKEAAIEALQEQQVYWSPFGKAYHIDEDCHALNRTDTLTVGNVEEAIAARRTKLCSFCAKRHEVDGVATDNKAAAENELPVADDTVNDIVDDVVDELVDVEADDAA